MKTVYLGSALVTTALFVAGQPAFAFPVDFGGSDGAQGGSAGHFVDNPSLNSTTSAANEATESPTRPITQVAPGTCVQGRKVLGAADANACSRAGGIWNSYTSRAGGAGGNVTNRQHRADELKGGLMAPGNEAERTGE